jgi:hypothetical protein
MLLLGPVWAEEACPVEVKVLLSSVTPQRVIASFGFDHERAGLVYFFDSESLDLLMQGVIVRVRQGANNDLTVKFRPPPGNPHIEHPQLRDQFACEIDRTQAAANVSYSVGRHYKATSVPETGTDVYSLFTEMQSKLLSQARVSIDWGRVIRIADIHSTTWQTGAQSPYGKLSLELWEWPAGRVLELSAKGPPATDASRYADLERLLAMKSLPLDTRQDTKTNLVLQSLSKGASR